MTIPEDWCHINYFLAQPETIGRVVITNPSTPSLGGCWKR